MTDPTRSLKLLGLLTARGTDPSHPNLPAWQVATSRMADAQRGHPGSSMGGGGGHGGSPVEAMLDQPDIGGDALAAWRKACTQLEIAARTFDRLLIAWTPRQPSAAAVRATDGLAALNARVCEHCEKGALRADMPTDVGGNLTTPLRLCRWCYDFVRSTGHLADRRTLERRANDQRIRVRA